MASPNDISFGTILNLRFLNANASFSVSNVDCNELLSNSSDRRGRLWIVTPDSRDDDELLILLKSMLYTNVKKHSINTPICAKMNISYRNFFVEPIEQADLLLHWLHNTGWLLVHIPTEGVIRFGDFSANQNLKCK